MGLLDFISNHNQQNVASLPDNVKAQAVEAARPAAQAISQSSNSEASAPSATPVSPARGRSLGVER